MPNVKLRPGQQRRYFVGIDGTKTIDTVVWGHLWNEKFRWRNLLWELDRDTGDRNRRIDNAHSKLPLARLGRPYRGRTLHDTCILPEGVDAKGTDKVWAGSDKHANRSDIIAACEFTETFILSPGAEKNSSSLNDAGSGVVADIVYISSHGASDGTMSGDIFFAWIFDPAKLASKGAHFSGPGWMLLSNCNTLKPGTHGDWLNLMTGLIPLRGIVGFQDLCPFALGSAHVFASFINRLARRQTFIQAWEGALRARGIEERWIVLCHENAVDDTIPEWNAGRLTAIPPTSKVLMFNKDNRTGLEVTPPTDPFEAFWSKGTTRITASNRSSAANRLKVGDAATIAVKPPVSVGSFTDGTQIKITLIYIRANYPKAHIDINRMFTVTGQSGALAPTTADLNPASPGHHDSWILAVTGSPSEVQLDLRCDDLDMLPFSNYSLWLRVDISTMKHDFVRNGSIVVEK